MSEVTHRCRRNGTDCTLGGIDAMAETVFKNSQAEEVMLVLNDRGRELFLKKVRLRVSSSDTGRFVSGRAASRHGGSGRCGSTCADDSNIEAQQCSALTPIAMTHQPA